MDKFILEKLNPIMDKMQHINYGFVDNDENIYPDNDEDWDNSFSEKYCLQSPEVILKTKYGVCWDQVELERFYFEKENIKISSYFIVNYDGKMYPTHTFIIVENDNKFYWFEHSWEPHRGIKKFLSLNDALAEIESLFNKMLNNKYGINNKDTVIYRYSKPNYGINCGEFYEHCESGEKIIL